MSIAEKLIKIAENEQKVYEAGKTEGYEAGKTKDYEAGKTEGYEAGKTEGYEEAEAVTMALIDRSITELVIPVGTKIIGANALAYAARLTKLTIPEGVEWIGSSALSYMGQMKKIDLPLSCKSITSYSMQGSSNLECIRFGDTREIQICACQRLGKCVTYDFSRNTSVPTLTNTNAFDGINASAKILVPPSLYHEWIETTNWSAYADYILVKAPEFPDPGYVSQGLEINNGIVEGLGSCTDSTVVIPSEYNGEPVTDIAISGMEEETIEHLVFNDLICYVSWTLGYLPELKRVTFGAGLKGVGPGVFNENAKCTVYDFTRCLAVPELQLLLGDEVCSFTGMPDDCRIYVPHSLYDEWINDTNWSYYADRIVPAI